MYKLIQHSWETAPTSVLLENLIIPFDPANTDYQVFKADLAKGVELQDADGTAMTADQIQTFVGTLP